MPVDYHIHTRLCGHAEGELEEYVSQARARGLEEMGFSDHLPLYHLEAGDGRRRRYAMDLDELDGYVREVERLAAGARAPVIRLGIEADYIPGREADLERLLRAYPFDYVIGSVHFIDDWAFDDPLYVEEYSRRDLDRLYERYFGLVAGAAATGLFDIIGHVDLIKKFGFFPAGDLEGLYAGTAVLLARAGVAVEVSTAGLRKPVGEIYPGKRLLSHCRQAGVPVTLGSDAHAPRQVAMDYAQALDLLAAVGYDQVAVFRQRKKTLRSIQPGSGR